MNRIPLRRALVTAIFALLPGLAAAEVYTTQVAVVDGDILQARQSAVRAILQDAGLSGELEIQSAIAQVGQDIRQTAIIKGSSRIRTMAWVDEVREGENLRLSLRIDSEPLPTATCEPLFWTRNLAIGLQGGLMPFPAGKGRRGMQLLLEAIAGQLPRIYPSAAQPGEPIPNPAYRLLARSRPGTPGSGEYRLTLQIAGGDGSRIAQFDHVLKPETLVGAQKESLGYANLVREGLSAEGVLLAETLAEELAGALRCLPVVVALPEHGLGESYAIEGIDGMPAGRPTMVFHAAAFPVREGGAIDLARLDGLLDVSGAGPDWVQLRMPDAGAGTPRPRPGGFILLK